MEAVKLILRSGVFISFLNFTTCFSQMPVAAIDSFYTLHYAGQFNGGLLMAMHGKPVYQKSFGQADFSTNAANNPSSRFNLASIAKTITSTAVLQLMDKRKLSVEDHVHKYLPQFPFPSITIRHLLTHTSGLPNLELYEDIVKQFPDSIIDNHTIIPALRVWTKELPFSAGDKWQYSNTNFDLLSLIIEKISGMTYAKYLEKYIFRPAGMIHTSVIAGPSGDKGVVAHVYPTWFTNNYISADSIARFKYINYNLSGLTGSTNIVTTLSDMLSFNKAFFSGKLLKRETMEMALTPVKLNDGSIFYEGSMDTMLGEGTGSYGMGWSLYEQPGFGKAAGHGGFNYGLATFYFHNLEKNQTIISYDNTAGAAFGKVITSALFLLNDQKGIQKINRSSLARIYGTTLKQKGADEAIVVFNNLKSDSINYYVSERELNWLGYDLLRAGMNPLAVEVFKINTLLFPNSFNVYDSFAEALLESGKKQEAIVMYQKSLQLNSNNIGAKAALEKIKTEDTLFLK